MSVAPKFLDALLDVVCVHIPETVELHDEDLTLQGVYTIVDKADTSLHRYWLAKGKFYSEKFTQMLLAKRLLVNQVVVVNKDLIPRKVAVLEDEQDSDVLVEVYLSAIGEVYGIGYNAPIQVVLDKALVASLLPIIAYAKQKNPDYGECYYHPLQHELYVVGDDGLTSKAATTLHKKAEAVGVSLTIEAEAYPQTTGWVFIQENGSCTEYNPE